MLTRLLRALGWGSTRRSVERTKKAETRRRVAAARAQARDFEALGWRW